MPYLAEAAISAAYTWPSTDFMRRAYELNGEPLRLLDRGQRWLARILSQECGPVPYGSALVLGGTPWLSPLVARIAARTTVADTSAAMLSLCANTTRDATAERHERRARFLLCNWLTLPETVGDLRLVVGDNAFSFLRYPDEWARLFNILADRMTEDSLLICRVLSVPAGHRRLCPAEIVDTTLARRTPVNFTAVRIALLFAHWDPATYTIRPEDALSTFETHRAEFDPILCDRASASDNDLLSIEKYRDTGVTYAAPPLAEAIAMFERRFFVRAVYFGPYEMSQYFPLIVASKARG